jgi:FkbM family methyltransferase
MQLLPGTLLAHPSMVTLRNRLRGNPLLRGLYRAWAGQDGYEARFGRSLLAGVHGGDVVWDIGANVGLYSEKFLHNGAREVICFEPAPAAIAALESRLQLARRTGRARIVPVALSDRRGQASFVADGSSPVNRIGVSAHGSSIEVPVMRGDQALLDYSLPVPQVIKVDVEGYELEVIEGLAGVFADARVRAVFVEVHFALLHERGVDVAPARIVRFLEERGFTVRWIDGSHLAAIRGA